MHHARIAAVAIVLVIVAAGANTTAVAGSGSRTEPITIRQAVAFEHAVNLRPSDLPGSKAVPQELSAPSPTGEQKHSATPSPREEFPCARLGMGGRHPVRGEASLLTGSYGLVASVVVVMPSHARAAAELAALDTRQGRACLARRIGEGESIEAEKKTTSFALKVTFVPVTRLLGPDAVAVHVFAELPPPHEKDETSSKASFFHASGAFFRVGPAEIALITLDPKQQLPSAIEHHLLATLRRRAESHKV